MFLGAPPSLKMLKWEKLPSGSGGNGVAAIEHGRAHVFNQRPGGSSNIGSAGDGRAAMRRRRGRDRGVEVGPRVLEASGSGSESGSSRKLWAIEATQD